ncbi:tetratricopeptide repeat protein [Abyssalbus ytuae]|uniref:Tetratricopeptide repeat protein n=1 Tax=Abyssalbus ytuae TaxID=2926907 RepID=A0A9E7CYD2_9FLAO|nr:tetratricopeptide repeat protein [Abyssalbus ytuae]UOB16525.1 tetratricopeptide repeat protein [Abyssalbus ytuae]
MNIRNKYIFLLILLAFFSAKAQQSQVYTHHLKEYQDALKLYNDKQYRAAQLLFKNVKHDTDDYEIEADCDYYIANSAIRLNQYGADKMMEDFVKNYSTSTKRNSALLEVGNYYFEQGKYANAAKWYDMTENLHLGYSEREKINFRKGYSLFATNKHESAKPYFEKVVNSKEYGAQAKYYIGYMAYEGNDYNEAQKYFEQISENQNVNENLSYYQADMNFKSGEFEKALKEALQQLPRADRNEQSELNKIIGESYFNLEKYEEAIPYLKEYKGTQGKWNNTDFYQLGYAYYKQADYENAISQFNKIIDARNAVAQNAYYHLAECYLKTGKKQQALNAFKNASEMSFSKDIQKDSWLNYARLSYDIGNPYENVSDVLIKYIEKYPDSNYKSEIQDLLVDSYITSKNYEAAIKLLESNRSYSNKQAYQKVTFYRGLELFNEGKYNDAKNYFSKSLSEPRDVAYVARATFWKAETDYNLGNFQEAVVGYKEFKQFPASSQTEEFKNADYNLAYAYFKQKEYAQAAEFFNTYISSGPADKVRLNDSYLRMGDSYFVTSQYNLAIKAYDKAIKADVPGTDYAYFQKAISYGFINKNETKIKELNNFINSYVTSSYRDDALYELGNTYVNNDNSSKGIETYTKLVSEHKNSSYVSKAILREGLVYYNEGKNDLALSRFRLVVDKYSNTQEAIQAVSTSKLIYIDEGRVNEYANWVKGLDFVEVTDAELDNATFEGAEKHYLRKNTEEAERGLENYVSQFPSGMHILKARFYLAQTYFEQGDKLKSIPHYEFVINRGASQYSEQALARLGQIYLENNEYAKAIPVLSRLEQEADFPQNITFAQSNLMKSNYELRNYIQTINYAEKVLKNEKIDDRVKSDAHIMIARSAIKTDNQDKAKVAYSEVLKTATGALAAEALYYDAYFKNKEGNYELSNQVVQDLAKNYPGYKEYGARGLIIMAKNFYALDDAFQATYILESVISNFTAYPDIIVEAQNELTKIKAEEAKRNSSVTPHE